MDSSMQAVAGNGQHLKRRGIEEKKRIVAETLTGGATVAKVAQKHGVHVSQVYQWRKQYGKRKRRGKQRNAVRLLPVTVAEVMSDKRNTRSLPAGTIEIEFARGRLRMVEPEAALLRVVLEMLQ